MSIGLSGPPQVGEAEPKVRAPRNLVSDSAETPPTLPRSGPTLAGTATGKR